MSIANYRIIVDVPEEPFFTELLEVVKVHSGTGMSGPLQSFYHPIIRHQVLTISPRD